MKNLLAFIIFCLFAVNLFAQNLNGTINGTTINSCSATLYDSGGSLGTYQASENFSVTFCSTNGDCMQLSFVTFDTETNYDYLYIYDGSNTSATLLATLNGNIIPSNIVTSGSCVTIKFTSDGSVQNAGFQINITCTGNCYVPPPPPTNNDPCSATSLTVNTICNPINATNLGATNSVVPTPSCSYNYTGGDVWFSAVVPASGLLEVDFQQSSPGFLDGGIALYTGTDCNNLTEYSCEEPWGGYPGPQYVLSSSNLAGQTIWIRVWELDNDNQGAFNICALEPPPFFETNIVTYTPQQLVEDILVTGCLEALNTVYTGDPTAIGYFSNGSITGFESGVVMGTGLVSNVAGPATASDNVNFNTPLTNIENDLSSIAQQNGGSSDMYDVAVLEFDFIPSSDTTEFDFVFASMEYTSYECSMYNDVFAFFLSGPGITGPYTNNSINIALVPGTTTPITISTINGSGGITNCGYASYPQYYVEHSTAGPDFQVRGYTTPLTAILADLTPCETYHITMAIADAGDGSLSSYVFFDEASFTSGGEITMANNASVGTSNQIYEGCTDYWVFERIDTSALAMLDTIHIDLIIGGPAIQGTDYTNVNSNLVILPGEYSDTLYYSAFFDNVQETNEYIVFSLLNGCPCSLQSTNDTIWVIDNFNLNPIISNDTLICGNSPVTVSVSINPLQNPSIVSYLWDNGSTGTSITVNPTNTETHWVTVSSSCMADTTVSMTINVVPTINPNFTISKDTICIGENVTIQFAGSTSSGSSFNWNFDSGNPSNATGEGPHTVNWNTSGQKTITLYINDSGCLNDTSITLFVSPNPSVIATPTNNLCFGNCEGEILAQPQDNFVPYTYLWSDSQTTNPAIGLCVNQYQVTISNRFGCTSTTSETITQPTAINYNVTLTNVLCFGSNNGTASISVTGGTPPYTYNWVGVNSFTSTSANITGLFAGQYFVTVTDANSCFITETITITEPSTPLESSIESTNISCFGLTDGQITVTPIGGTSPYNFNWNNGEISQTLNNLPANTYNVTIIDNNGCVGYNSATIAQPLQIINNSTTIVNNNCYGQNLGSATINISGGVTPYSYNWSNGTTTQSNSQLFAGTYNVTVTDFSSCTFVITNIEITEPNKLIASILDLPTMCIGETKDLTVSVTGGTPNYSYQWSTTETTETISINPTDTTIYAITVTDNNNCQTIATRTINVYAPISINVTANKYSVCPGDPVIITTIANGGNGNYIYTLENGNAISSVYTVYPYETTSYSITVSDNCGSPTDNDVIQIETYPIPSFTFSSDILQGCQALSVNFISQTSDTNTSYLWNFGDNNTSYAQNPNHVYENWGSFNVSLEITSNNGCKNFLQIDNMINVYKNPKAQFTATPQTASIIKPEIKFTNLSQDNFYNYWWFDDGNISNLISPTHKYINIPETYNVKLLVKTDKGCADSTFSQVIIVNEYTLYVPSAFSPDNDNINDYFSIVGNGVNLDEFDLKIYNRWGEIIFETTDMTNSWNGKTKSGKYVELGVYKWLITYQDENGIEYQKTGNVTVIK